MDADTCVDQSIKNSSKIFEVITGFSIIFPINERMILVGLKDKILASSFQLMLPLYNLRGLFCKILFLIFLNVSSQSMKSNANPTKIAIT